MTETLAANQLAPGLVVVLAAGAGTRMRSATAKVLHPVLGKPMLGHVLDAVAETDPGIVAVVVGHQRERVEQYVAAQYPQAVIAVQD
ncbi:MAG: NTP transferase domain-containing protein, partial [Candidatus Nanopelagicales bacterium]